MDDQLERIYSSSVPIQDIALKTCKKQWTIGGGGERGPGISVLMARHDDDDVDISIAINLLSSQRNDSFHKNIIKDDKMCFL